MTVELWAGTVYVLRGEKCSDTKNDQWQAVILYSAQAGVGALNSNLYCWTGVHAYETKIYFAGGLSVGCYIHRSNGDTKLNSSEHPAIWKHMYSSTEFNAEHNSYKFEVYNVLSEASRKLSLCMSPVVQYIVCIFTILSYVILFPSLTLHCLQDWLYSSILWWSVSLLSL